MKKIIWPLVLLVVLFFIGKGYWNSLFDRVSSDKKTESFIITKGAGVSEIAKKLKQANLIKSELAFKIYIKQSNLSDKLQAGSYKLSPSQSVKELVETLQSGSEDVWVTLIEGWRVEEMAAKLHQVLGIDEKEFIRNSKEGYMFPDTYLFPKEATVGYITDTLKTTFESRLTDELKNKIKSKGLTLSQGVILASIVEREGRSQKVRREIAGILLKRLKIDMGLNVDASLQYILGYQKDENPPAGGWWKRNLTAEDKKIDSPYNTYLYRGLPPNPICNPSISSLQAVADADPNTPYLYYYHDSKGNSYYAKTLDEHNENVANHP